MEIQYCLIREIYQCVRGTQCDDNQGRLSVDVARPKRGQMYLVEFAFKAV